jgi:hypothetical protein
MVIIGIFTTRNISNGDAVLGGPDGLSIPIEDYGDRAGEEWGKKKTHWINLWGEYVYSTKMRFSWWRMSLTLLHVCVCVFILSHACVYSFCFGITDNYWVRSCIFRRKKTQICSVAAFAVDSSPSYANDVQRLGVIMACRFFEDQTHLFVLLPFAFLLAVGARCT